MASTTKKVLLSTGVVKTTQTGERQMLENNAIDLIGYVKVSSYTDGTFTAKIEHSPDGVEWFDLVAFAGLAAAGKELKFPTTPCLGYVRASCAVAGAPGTGAAVLVELHSRIDK